MTDEDAYLRYVRRRRLLLARMQEAQRKAARAQAGVSGPWNGRPGAGEHEAEKEARRRRRKSSRAARKRNRR